MTREHNLFVKDILDAIKDIEEFVGDMDFNEFCNDNKTRSAVVLKIEIMGEAVKNLPKEIRSKYKKIPWKDMAGMRDKISHFYFGIDYKIVWKVVKDRLPEIKPAIEKVFNDLTKNDKP